MRVGIREGELACGGKYLNFASSPNEAKECVRAGRVRE
jgi:hypothetical protein